jgi:hypothetical protein
MAARTHPATTHERRGAPPLRHRRRYRRSSGPIERQSARDHPTRNVLLPLVAGGHDAPEGVVGARDAAHRRKLQAPGECAKRDPATPVKLAVIASATLPPLRGVDPPYPDRKPGDRDRIAIQHMSAADDFAGCRPNAGLPAQSSGERRVRPAGGLRSSQQRGREQDAARQQQDETFHDARRIDSPACYAPADTRKS